MKILMVYPSTFQEAIRRVQALPDADKDKTIQAALRGMRMVFPERESYPFDVKIRVNWGFIRGLLEDIKPLPPVVSELIRFGDTYASEC